MSEEIEKLIKIQGILNKNKYHLYINTDLEKKAKWDLYQVFADYDKYMSMDNGAILESETDTIEDLINYLRKHNGFKTRF
ncbi:MAG: hypothetical protein IJK18_08160 [Clostridia bacterium]|nr:hypothetical protein [Clostridia bacterium]